ncbi:MAG: biotin synthase BioB [Deltaproteobacteria bacterium]|jgi:biotin synthase|nr:biotin synthase BioB [Deltaproteobacteria bacterium]
MGQSQENLSPSEALEVLDSPAAALADLFVAAGTLRRRHRGQKVFLQAITSLKNGDCAEDCAYCAQSNFSSHETPTYRLLPADELLEKGQRLAEAKVDRHCLGFSGLRFSDAEIGVICARIAELKAQTDTPICCSIGLLTSSQAKALKAAGVDRVNHNLNTSERYYPQICSTHTYAERIKNLWSFKAAGLELCCGGIVGLGEEKTDVVAMLMAIKELKPASVPINFYVPIPGTALATRAKAPITSEYRLKVLALARFLLPNVEIRCAAGREKYLADFTPYVLAAADSIFVEGYLTVGGQGLASTIAAIEAAGYEAAWG